MNAPNIDDLILNIPDGCFYRVIEVREDSVSAAKLTIAGSGSGGGGGGEITTGSYTFNRIGKADVTALYQDSCSVSFSFTAVDAEGESTGNAKGIVKVGGLVKKEFTARQGNNSIDVGEYLALGENRVEITLTLNTGNADFTVTKKWNITTVSVTLLWDYDETTTNYTTNSFNFAWSVTGNVSKTTHIIIDDLYTLVSETTTRLNTQTITIASEDLNSFGLNHGAHKVEMYVTAEIDDSTIQTPSTIKNVIFVDVNSRSPIISCNFIEDELTQYNTVQIPIIIYNPEATAGVSTVMLRENGELRDTWSNIVNNTVYYWSYTPTVAGEKTLTIICNEAEKQLIFNVTALDIDNEEIGGYAFKFKATDFSSNAAV